LQLLEPLWRTAGGVVVSLKTELQKADTPLRVWLEERLPHVNGPRGKLAATLRGVTPCLPDDDKPLWMLLGSAISARLVWQIAPGEQTVVQNGAGYVMAKTANPELALFVPGLLRRPVSEVSADVAARASVWAGVFDGWGRVGVFGTDRWAAMLPSISDTDAMLAAVDDYLAADVAAVAVRSAPVLEQCRTATIIAGPTFAGSHAIGGADADLVCGTNLVEIKAHKDSTVPGRDIWQLACYALLDFDDRFGIDTVTLLSARQGTSVSWPLVGLLTELAGKPVDVAELRASLRKVLPKNSKRINSSLIPGRQARR
jgi:hypothetical protein